VRIPDSSFGTCSGCIIHNTDHQLGACSDDNTQVLYAYSLDTEPMDIHIECIPSWAIQGSECRLDAVLRFVTFGDKTQTISVHHFGLRADSDSIWR
jgi:hypothetical protein